MWLEVSAQPLTQVIVASAGQDRAHSLSPDGVGHAEDDRLGHGWVGLHDVTHMVRINILTAEDDECFSAAFHHDPPVLIEVTAIRGQHATSRCDGAFHAEASVLHKHAVSGGVVDPHPPLDGDRQVGVRVAICEAVSDIPQVSATGAWIRRQRSIRSSCAGAPPKRMTRSVDGKGRSSRASSTRRSMVGTSEIMVMPSLSMA